MIRMKSKWILLGLLGLFALGIGKNSYAAFPSNLETKPMTASAIDGKIVTVYEDSSLKIDREEIHSEGLTIKAVDVSEDQKALYGSYKNDAGQSGKGWLPADAFVKDSSYKHIYATVRDSMTIYSDWDLYSVKASILKYSGIIAMNEKGDAVQVVYQTKKGYGLGWLSKENFENTLRYDGRDKQILRNGAYRFTNDTSQKNWILEYKSKKRYYIYDEIEKAYLCVEEVEANTYDPSQEKDPEWLKSGWLHQLAMIFDKTYKKKVEEWEDSKKQRTKEKEEYDQLVESGTLYEDAKKQKAYMISYTEKKKEASAFLIKRQEKKYSVQYGKLGLSLAFAKDGKMILKEKRENKSNDLWKVRAREPLMDLKDPMVLTQYDPEWCAKPYGGGGCIGTAGCGILSTVNAVYNLTGQYMDVMDLAEFAVRKNYRVVDHGTADGIFKAAAKEYGDQYGFAWDGAGDSLKVLKKKLKKGDIAIVHVEGHYASICGYNEKTQKYLLLDSAYLPKRETTSFGDWISEDRLLEGSLSASMFYYYKLK